MEIHKLLTPYNHTDGNISRISHIVIHYVGATSGAEANCKYFAACNRNASAHYFVDHDGSVWQSVEDKDIAWHCTNKNSTCNNNNSIGIEMCCKKNANGNWYFEDATVQSAIELTRELMTKYHIPPENVWRHYDCTGKACPEPFVREPSRWDAFKTAITATTRTVTKWVKMNSDWYYAVDGEFIKDKWVLHNEHWYRIGSNGKMLTGWQKVPDNKGKLSWCYFEESGDYIGAEWHERSDGAGFLERWIVHQPNQIL